LFAKIYIKPLNNNTLECKLKSKQCSKLEPLNNNALECKLKSKQCSKLEATFPKNIVVGNAKQVIGMEYIYF
jgi:hypothetical protein